LSESDDGVGDAGHHNFAMVVRLGRNCGLTAALTCHENQIFETRGVALDTTRNETFSRFARAQRLRLTGAPCGSKMSSYTSIFANR
jgi:hypothetical protein